MINSLAGAIAALFVLSALVAAAFGLASLRHLADPTTRNVLVMLGRGANARRELYTQRGWRYRNLSVGFQTITLALLIAFAFAL